ncbi:DNA adenine methylase [Candidatus Poribacteria bacterium]|nr:DNA adenine methylase [Candidatus Poribacteria bacterium]
MITSPLRYPGGKARLFSLFSEIISSNNLYNTTYCEPFAGGAGLALRLLTAGFVPSISLNDIDQSIYSFWVSILRNTSKFCDLIENTPITIDEWHNQRNILKESNFHDTLSLGFSAYFLNRTNRSGIIEGAGPIGGIGQSGTWRMHARFNKQTQIGNIVEISKYSAYIELSNLDAIDFIANKFNSGDNFIYLDPPYYVKGRELYKNFYKHADHVNISEILKANRDKFWVLTYDDSEQIRQIYDTFTPMTYSLNYSVGPKVRGCEVMFMSDRVTPPRGGVSL